MKFTKMQGLGNDYVYVNCVEKKLEHASETAVRVSDRHFGIGSDGLILINSSDMADFEMEICKCEMGAAWGNVRKRDTMCREICI